MRDPVLGQILEAGIMIEQTASGWYVVWYWLDDDTYTHQKFDDYEDAIGFAREKASGTQH